MSTLRDKIIACYQGKNIGGTLGAPYEARNHYLHLSYYNPVPTEPATNDDLDLQLVWLRHLAEFGFGLTGEQLGQAWLDHIDFHPDEYGTAIANLKKGIMPPVSGIHNNFFANALGAAIRSELWAAIFPGQPEVAAHYAWLDGSVDHGGDGLLIIIFLAMLESDLFCSGSLEQSLQKAFDALPESRLKGVIAGVRSCYDKKVSYEGARDWVMTHFHSNNCSDAVMNMGFIMIGLLYGEGDFERSLLCAVNCGQDTDSTGATVGAILGIRHGSAGIPDRWLAPIGNAVRMSSFIRDLQPPPTIEALADEIEEMTRKSREVTLPRMSLPLQLPEVQDFSDRVRWRVNGQIVELDGFILDVRFLHPNRSADVVMETEIVSPVDRDVRLLTCAAGLNKFYFDDQYLGQWGALKDTPMPAFHRTSGGLCWRLHLKAGVRHRVKLAIYSVDEEINPIYCGLADVECEGRHLVDVKWGIPAE